MRARTQQYKNKAAYGSELLTMNGDTYAMRRKVMDVIYEAKNRGYKLPRVEVRIVTSSPCVEAYAYRGMLVVHVCESTMQQHKFTQVILHELGHAIFGLGRIEGCPLMDCQGILTKDTEHAWKLFDGYYRTWAKL